jgi:hypothetical protein
MKRLKKRHLLGVLAAVAMSCLGATPSSATTSMDGGAFSLTSFAVTWTITGLGAQILCPDSVMSGTTPAGTATTTLAVPVTLSYAQCFVSSVPVTITPSEQCNTPAHSLQLNIMRNQPAIPQASAQLTLPSTCTIDLSFPTVGCTMLITGDQTIGNGTTGIGGGAWTNVAPKSAVHFIQATVPDLQSNGVGLGCPSAGTHSATLTNTYTVSTVTNVTVTP